MNTKESLLNRLLLVLLTLVVLFAAFLCVGLAARIVPADKLYAVIALAAGNFFYALLFGLIGIALAALAVRVLFVFVPNRRGDAKTGGVTVREGADGSLQISNEALQNIVGQYCAGIPAVKQQSSTVHPGAEGAALRLRVALAPEANIAETCAALQAGLRQYMEEACGLHISGVDVSVVPQSAMRK